MLCIFGVQALWNWLIPELFHGPVLTFWQTVGLFFLAKILLTGVAPRSRYNHRKDWKNKCEGKYRHTMDADQNVAAAGQV